MATGTRHRVASDELSTSRYDQVSGLLVAVLVVLGFMTLMMFMVWLSTRLFWVQAAVPVTILEDVGGGGSGQTLGGQQELEEPSPEEFQEVTDPPVEVSLESIASVVSTEAVQLESLEGSTSLGTGEGTGTGPGRGPGPGGPGTSDGIPAWERWELRLSAKSDAEYARQLDFFEIELGVAGGGSPVVEYITRLSTGTPTVRKGNPQDEKRLNFLHRSGELRAADRRLAAKAGVQAEGRVVFQFYTDRLYQQLLTLEAQRKGARRIREVRKTIFGVRPAGSGFELYVIDQQYIGA